MKMGRYGSRAVRLPIHAPPIPSASRSRGPTQQTDAAMAANMPAAREPFAFNVAITITQAGVGQRYHRSCTVVRSQGVGRWTARLQLAAWLGPPEAMARPFA